VKNKDKLCLRQILYFEKKNGEVHERRVVKWGVLMKEEALTAVIKTTTRVIRKKEVFLL